MEKEDWLFADGQPIPKYAYGVLAGTDHVILIKRGERGYWPVDNMSLERADQRNAEMGVTPTVRQAMQTGSLWGWDSPWARDLSRYKDVPLPEMAQALKELAQEHKEKLRSGERSLEGIAN